MLNAYSLIIMLEVSSVDINAVARFVGIILVYPGLPFANIIANAAVNVTTPSKNHRPSFSSQHTHNIIRTLWRVSYGKLHVRPSNHFNAFSSQIRTHDGVDTIIPVWIKQSARQVSYTFHQREYVILRKHIAFTPSWLIQMTALN